ncbi:hypothetical protein ACU8V7_12630 [Zobellia nedashkovskayae]
MKQSILKISVFAVAFGLFTACSNDDNIIVNDESIIEEPSDTDSEELEFQDMESDWVRLSLLTDDSIDLMQADSGEITYSVDAVFAEGESFYTTNSGRYLAAIDRAGGQVRFFDSGISNHEDHGHEYEAQWASPEFSSLLPTHYTGSEGDIVIFNDGDGSIVYVDEESLEIPSYQPEVFMLENTVAHHGAAVRLDNGMFVATFKNTDEAGGIPQMVKFIDEEGTVIDDNGGIEVESIHGVAVNGDYGVFGSTDGIILVDTETNIDLIENIEGLNADSGNWLASIKGHDESDHFFARAGNLGVFMIDPETKELANIYSGDDVTGDLFNFDGHYYILYTSDNTIHVFDAETGTELISRTVEIANIPELANTTEASNANALDEDLSPVIVSSDKFLYVLAPNRVQIKVLQIENLEHVHTIELETPVNNIKINGFSIEGDQDVEHDH